MNTWLIAILVGGGFGLCLGMAVAKFMAGDVTAGIIRCVSAGLSLNTLLLLHKNR